MFSPLEHRRLALALFLLTESDSEPIPRPGLRGTRPPAPPRAFEDTPWSSPITRLVGTNSYFLRFEKSGHWLLPLLFGNYHSREGGERALQGDPSTLPPSHGASRGEQVWEMTMEGPALWAATMLSAAWEEGSPGEPGGFRDVTGGQFVESRFAKTNFSH